MVEVPFVCVPVQTSVAGASCSFAAVRSMPWSIVESVSPFHPPATLAPVVSTQPAGESVKRDAGEFDPSLIHAKKAPLLFAATAALPHSASAPLMPLLKTPSYASFVTNASLGAGASLGVPPPPATPPVALASASPASSGAPPELFAPVPALP